MTRPDKTRSFRNVSDLDPGLAAALLAWGLALADTKYLLGRRLSEWVNGAPALEAAVAPQVEGPLEMLGQRRDPNGGGASFHGLNLTGKRAGGQTGE